MTDDDKPNRTRKHASTTSIEVARDINATTPQADAVTQGPAAKPESKTSRITGMLQRQEGASLNELVEATGWLPHTTRAALTGLKRKGHTITSEKVDGIRRYRGIGPQ